MEIEDFTNYLLLDKNNKVCGKIILTDGKFSLVEYEKQYEYFYWKKTSQLKKELRDKLKNDNFYYYQYTVDLLLKFRLVKKNIDKILINE